MRELKFRAWDKVEKKYYYNIQMVYDSMDVPCCCAAFGHFLIEEMRDECGDGTGEKRFYVEQFTGRVDSNNREIYEGDKVRAINGFVGTVTYDEDSARFIVSGYYDSSSDDPQDIFGEGFPIVIGTINEGEIK